MLLYTGKWMFFKIKGLSKQTYPGQPGSLHLWPAPFLGSWEEHFCYKYFKYTLFLTPGDPSNCQLAAQWMGFLPELLSNLHAMVWWKVCLFKLRRGKLKASDTQRYRLERGNRVVCDDATVLWVTDRGHCKATILCFPVVGKGNHGTWASFSAWWH